METLTNAVSGQSQNVSGNRDTNFSGKHAIIPGHCKKKIGTSKEILFHVLIEVNLGIPKIREVDPNFQGDLN